MHRTQNSEPKLEVLPQWEREVSQQENPRERERRWVGVEIAERERERESSCWLNYSNGDGEGGIGFCSDDGDYNRGSDNPSLQPFSFFRLHPAGWTTSPSHSVLASLRK